MSAQPIKFGGIGRQHCILPPVDYHGRCWQLIDQSGGLRPPVCCGAALSTIMKTGRAARIATTGINLTTVTSGQGSVCSFATTFGCPKLPKQPDYRLPGFRVVCVAHVLLALFRPVQDALASATPPTADALPTMRAGRQTSPRRGRERRTAQARLVRAGETHSRAYIPQGCHLVTHPRHPAWGAPPCALYVCRDDCLIQPPSKRPISATIRLTCSYCPLVSQPH
jgi:hypothetical protein